MHTCKTDENASNKQITKNYRKRNQAKIQSHVMREYLKLECRAKRITYDIQCIALVEALQYRPHDDYLSFIGALV